MWYDSITCYGPQEVRSIRVDFIDYEVTFPVGFLFSFLLVNDYRGPNC